MREVKPEVIVNAAAYTAVDKAESPSRIRRSSSTPPRRGLLAEEAKALGALLVHYSTDYVFDGAKQDPYTENDAPNPVSVYGKSKLAGEKAIQATGCRHLMFRTSWVYASRGKNFLLTILRLAKERPELRVVDDQHGAPTWARTIAEATTQILRRPDPPSGIYHLTAAGETTWVRVRARDRAAKRTIDTREGHRDRRVPDASEASNELRSRQYKGPNHSRRCRKATGGRRSKSA